MVAAYATLLPLGAASLKSYDAAKAWFTNDSDLIFSLDVKTLTKTSAGRNLINYFFAQSGGQREIQQIKSICSIDVIKSVNDVTFVSSPGQKLKTILSLNNLAEAKFSECLVKYYQNQNQKKVAVERNKQILKYFLPGEPAIHLLWPSSDVVVIPEKLREPAALPAATDLNATSGIGAALASHRPDATFSMVTVAASIVGEIVNKTGTAVHPYARHLLFSANLRGGQASLYAEIKTDSVATAKKFSEETSRSLTSANSAGRIPRQLANVLKNLKITTNGVNVIIQTSLPENDLSSLLKIWLNQPL